MTAIRGSRPRTPSCEAAWFTNGFQTCGYWPGVGLKRLIAAAVALNILGVFLHYGSDAQKHYTLRYHQGLISEGFFARCRNTNYLGEILIYLSFALLAMHWLPYAVLAGFVVGVFLPNMRRKDASLSRYPEFAAYQKRSGWLLPRLGS